MATESTFITIREAARRLGVHENTVRRYADRGLIRAVRLPSGVRRLRRGDIEALQGTRSNVSGENGAPRIPAVASSVTVEELIKETGAEPVKDVTALARPGVWDSDEDAEGFIAITLAERERDR